MYSNLLEDNELQRKYELFGLFFREFNQLTCLVFTLDSSEVTKVDENQVLTSQMVNLFQVHGFFFFFNYTLASLMTLQISVKIYI